ncbi:dTMP kinase [Timonella senegalensis]|uniref:dTMP kinase n=1 Tax=Timonella senegalensis TaxID=1465825 RepID=UPI0028AE4118|nr:dTMP kinase [Timonella senegalensis]
MTDSPYRPVTAAPHAAHGVFISFEGGDGCGKTTQSRLLGQWLGEVLDREVVLTREPGGTSLGKKIRPLILHDEDMGPRAEALLYAADRSHHVQSLVRPALARGAIVVTDRYLDSSLAYQSGGRELTADDIRGLSLWATQGLMPVVTVLLDISPAAGAARFTDAPDRLESAGDEFHERTRQAYLNMAAAEPERFVTVDAHGSIEEIAALVRAGVARRLAEIFPELAERLASRLGGETAPLNS